MKISGAEILIKCLKKEGVSQIFGYPGGVVLNIFDTLYDEKDIDLNRGYLETGKDNDWRWAEQWLPHAAWYLIAIASR